MSRDGWKRPRFRNQFLLNSAWSGELPLKVVSTRDSSKFEEVFAQEALSENVGSSLRYPDFVA